MLNQNHLIIKQYDHKNEVKSIFWGKPGVWKGWEGGGMGVWMYRAPIPDKPRAGLWPQLQPAPDKPRARLCQALPSPGRAELSQAQTWSSCRARIGHAPGLGPGPG